MAMVDKIAVIGSGLVGRGWAIVCARANRRVALYDADAAALTRAMEIMERNFRDLSEFGLVSVEPARLLERIDPITDLGEAVAGASHVQEAAPEQLDLKRALFADLDRLSEPEAVIASSTSALPASSFTEHLPGRERCLVAHPVNPPYLIPLVELVPAPWTDSEVVLRTLALMTALGQEPVRINREIHGFVLNRLQGALLNEAFKLVEDGVIGVEDLDKTVRDGLGLRWAFMGPFETIDLNAPGGVADYIRRYSAMYQEMARSQAEPRAWTEKVTAKVESQRRVVLSEDRLQARQEWRDRRLMALSAHKLQSMKTITE
jgi:L-gulonate 3-dehydrogenase